jgi:hypothetical protein
MLLFKILIAILLFYIAACAVVFVYHKILRLSRFWRNLGMLIFFVVTCHNFGLKWTTISLLYLLVCVLNFILRSLMPSQTKFSNDYLTIDAALIKGSNFSYDKFKGYLNASPPPNQNQVCHHEEERRSDLPKISRLFLRAFVPLWLTCFWAIQFFSNSFKSSDSFHSFTFIVKNIIIKNLKNIKAV